MSSGFGELIEGFVRPSGSTNVYQGKGMRVDHLLVFDDPDRFRIQLIADLYRRLAPVLDIPVQARDDKMPQAILHLSDFILKFHRRAFSWSNVERVDELVHIHRAPDLRRAVLGILLRWENVFLHRIKNGMYDFRFTSEFAKELDWMSRASEQEMAALNFTLDESQFLKSIYRSRIEALGEEMASEFISGLAELHKFDEEYEVARAYLRRSIDLLDRRFRQDMRRMVGMNALEETFSGRFHGRLAARLRLGWGITRIRLMLQMAMSFERARDFEHAQIEYREARTLAEVYIRSLVAWLDSLSGDEEDSPIGTLGLGEDFESYDSAATTSANDYLFNLKHLPLLFQPLFAEAWLAEKSGIGADTAPAMIETALWRYRQWLPFLSPGQFSIAQESHGPLDVRHSSFALLMSELENKAGDLYFFKGRQLVPEDLSRKWSKEPESMPQGADGYLVRALYYYSLALHDVRRFNALRLRASGLRFGPRCSEETEESAVRTIGKEGWPDTAISSAAVGLADLADALFARVSYTRLVVCLARARQDASTQELGEKDDKWGKLDFVDKCVRDAYDSFVDWMELGSEELVGGNGPHNCDLRWRNAVGGLVVSVPSGTSELSRWLGWPAEENRCREGDLVVQESINPDPERLVASLLLGLVAGRLLERAGSLDSAVQQLLRTAKEAASVIGWVFEFNQVFLWTADVIDTWKYAEDAGTLGRRSSRYLRQSLQGVDSDLGLRPRGRSVALRSESQPGEGWGWRRRWRSGRRSSAGGADAGLLFVSVGREGGEWRSR